MRPGIHGTVVPLSRADERYAAAFNDAAQAYALTLEGLAVEPAMGESPTLRVPVEVVTETDPDELASALLTHGAALSLAAYGRPPTAALLRRLAEAVEKTRG